MINNLKIERFKCFESIEINFRRLTVFAGSNSVGKSSIIQSLLLCRSAMDKIKLQNLGFTVDDIKIPIPLNGNYNLGLGDSKEVLKRDISDNSIKFSVNEDFLSLYAFLAEEVIENVFHIDLFKWHIDPNSILSNQEFHYLNAERIGPRSRHEMDDLDFYNVGWQGEYSIQVLHEKRESEIAANKNFDFSNKTKTKLLPLVREWMGYIIPGFYIDEIKAYEKIKSAGVTINKSIPTNVGFGVSYVLPIVIAGLIANPDTVLTVENPEAHLHPSGQSRIGIFLARMAACGTQVIIETHSEHVINGIRIASLDGTIPYDNIVVNFITVGDNKLPFIKQIDVTPSGDLTSYPRGFFDQEQSDIATIVRYKMNMT